MLCFTLRPPHPLQHQTAGSGIVCRRPSDFTAVSFYSVPVRNHNICMLKKHQALLIHWTFFNTESFLIQRCFTNSEKKISVVMLHRLDVQIYGRHAALSSAWMDRNRSKHPALKQFFILKSFFYRSKTFGERGGGVVSPAFLGTVKFLFFRSDVPSFGKSEVYFPRFEVLVSMWSDVF